LSSAAVILSLSIDNEAAAVGITKLKPRSDAAIKSNEAISARLILASIDFIKEPPDTMSVKRISLMLRYRYEKIDRSYLFAQLLNRNHSYASTLDKFMSVIINESLDGWEKRH